MTQPLPSKREVTQTLLQTSFSVFLHLDPRRDRVVVPPPFRKQAHLVLEIGLQMPVPIPDLVVDDAGVSCTLSFSRKPYWCRLPWPCVFAVAAKDRPGAVWPEDIPKELAQQRRPQSVRPAPPDVSPPTAPATEPDKATDEQVPSTPPAGERNDAPAQESSQPDGARRRLPPYLRVVK